MDLKKSVLSGAKWLTLGRIFTRLLGIVNLIVYARLLSVDDFGTFAVLMIFAGFLGMFVDMGTSSALIHVQKPSNELLSSVFYFNIFIGFALFVVLSLLAVPISEFFEIPEIAVLLPIIAINFIIVSTGVVQKALYEKSMNFKSVAMFESFAALAGSVLGIGAAIYGLGVYSLLIQTLAVSITLVIFMWSSSSWRPMWYFSRKEIKKIFSFTMNLISFSTINYFARNADNFLIGKFIGSSGLGMYSMAYNIMLYPLDNITRLLVRVLFPAFSQIQNDNEKFKKAYLRAIFFIALFTFPLMAGLMSTADVLVNVLFGEKWQGLETMLMILVPVGMIQSIAVTNGSIYMAKGNTKTMFRIGAINSFVTVVAFVIGLPFGIEGVAIAYFIATLIMLYPNQKIAWGQIELKVREGLNEIFPILIISFIMALVVFLTGQMLNALIENQIIKLMIMVLSGVVSYIGLVRMKYGKLQLLLGELRG